jgi:hypothetical protein
MELERRMPDAPMTLICTGMACGALLATIGLMLWGSSRPVPRLSHAVRATRWLAGALLLVGTLYAWLLDHSLSAPAARFALMGALAALPEIRRRSSLQAHPDNALLILPALILVGGSLSWKAESGGSEPGDLPATLVVLALTVCGGLGARALGQRLSQISTQCPPVEEPPRSAAAAYALLTLVAGGTALVSLLRQGAVWSSSADEGRLASAWLAWSAVWAGPRQPAWLRALLMTIAALLLIVLVIGW